MELCYNIHDADDTQALTELLPADRQTGRPADGRRQTGRWAAAMPGSRPKERVISRGRGAPIGDASGDITMTANCGGIARHSCAALVASTQAEEQVLPRLVDQAVRSICEWVRNFPE
jgi:hypothetical protein